MKRRLWVVALLSLALMFIGQAMAQQSTSGLSGWSRQTFDNQIAAAKMIQFTGTVVSHDPMCHCVVVKTPKGEITMQDDYAKFMQEYNQAKGLTIGTKVSGAYKTVNHLNYLMSIANAE